MARILFYSLLATFVVVTFCTKSPDPKQKTEAPVTKMDQSLKEETSMEKRDDFDLMGTIMFCNETFRIDMSYLESLNETGSYPDETDKTPKCYIRCVLETLQVASLEGEYSPERAAMVFAGLRSGTPVQGIEEIANICAGRSKIIYPGESCKCERAYNFMKCLISMEIERYEKTTEN